jgi:hypothetical protein
LHHRLHVNTIGRYRRLLCGDCICSRGTRLEHFERGLLGVIVADV